MTLYLEPRPTDIQE